MSEVTTEIQELENFIADQKTLTEAADRAVRLASNPDFKALILDGYCLNEAARYVHESCDPGLSAENRADALAQAQASGHLKRFLSVTITMGNTANRNIREAEAALEAARAEV